MPTFVYDESAASNSGVFLLEIPDITWFKDSVLTALAEMTIPENWRGDTEDYRQYALLQANLMMATYKVLNFNPFPVGMIIAWSMPDNPPGYLTCDGSVYSITEYPELFSAIDYYWGYDDAGFMVPDFRGLTLIADNDVHPFQNQGGSETVTLVESQMPSHTHTDNGHTHGIQLTTNGVAVSPGELPVVVPIPVIPGSTDIGYADLSYTGESQHHNNMQPYVAIRYCIYAGR